MAVLKALAVVAVIAAARLAYLWHEVEKAPRRSALDKETGWYTNSDESYKGRIQFLERGRDNGGARMSFIEIIQAGTPLGFEAGKPGSPPHHIHTTQVETFEVFGGVMTYRLNGTVNQLNVGEIAVVEPGIDHQFWNNETSAELKIKVTLEPALSSEAFFEQLVGLTRDGYTSPFQMIPLLYDHGVELASDVPLPVRMAVKYILAPLGKVMGYKTMYPEYTSAESMESLKFVPKHMK